MAKTANRQQAVKNNNAPGYDLSQVSMRPQAKLTVNKPGDAYEQEADEVAQQVVQRQEKSQQGEEEEEEKLQTKSLANEITPTIQRAKSSKKAKAPKASSSKNDSKKVESPKESPKHKEKAPEAGTSKKPEADSGKAEDKKDAANKEKAPEVETGKKPEADKSKAEDSKDAANKEKAKEVETGKKPEADSGKAEDKKDAPEKEKDKNKKAENGDKDYKEMVKQAGSWEEVKKRYLKDKETMQGLIKFREEEVGKIIDQVKKLLSLKDKDLKVIAPGSTNLTSDYDVTFDAGKDKPLEGKAVKIFNGLFRKDWGKESGTIFDTNVYTTGHMPTGEGKEEKEKDKGKTQWQMTEEGEKKSDKLLDEMSLLKIRRNMSDTQWKKYKTDMLNGINDKNTKKETRRRLKKVEQLHKKSQQKFEKKISKLTKENQSLLQKLKSKLNNKKKNNAEADEKNQDGEMEANNRIYESYLTEAEESFSELKVLRREVRKQGVRTKEQAKKLDELTLKLQEMRSKALVFANKAYHTGGAVEHVVLNQQMNQGISINKNQYLQSINEQTGFAKEQINGNENMGMALWKSAKYVDRLCDAINNIEQEGFKIPQKQTEMVDIAKGLLEIKKNESLNTDDLKADAAEQFAKNHGYESKEQYLKDILTMNTEVNQQIRQNKDDGKKQEKGGKQSPQQQASSSNAASKRG